METFCPDTVLRKSPKRDTQTWLKEGSFFTVSRYLSGSSSHSSSSLLTSSSLWSFVLWLEGCNWNSVFPDSAANEEQAEYCIEEFARTLIISFSSMSSMLAFFGNSATEIVRLYSAINTCFDSNINKLNNTGVLSCSYFWSIGGHTYWSNHYSLFFIHDTKETLQIPSLRTSVGWKIIDEITTWSGHQWLSMDCASCATFLL